MKVHGKRLLAGESFDCRCTGPVERLAALEEQRELIESEIVLAARECLALAEASVSAASMQVSKWRAEIEVRQAKVDRLQGLAKVES